MSLDQVPADYQRNLYVKRLNRLQVLRRYPIPRLSPVAATCEGHSVVYRLPGSGSVGLASLITGSPAARDRVDCPVS